MTEFRHIAKIPAKGAWSAEQIRELVVQELTGSPGVARREKAEWSLRS